MAKNKGAAGIRAGSKWVRQDDGDGEAQTVKVMAVVDGFVLWREGQKMPIVSSTKHFLRLFEAAVTP